MPDPFLWNSYSKSAIPDLFSDPDDSLALRKPGFVFYELNQLKNHRMEGNKRFRFFRKNMNHNLSK